MLDELRTASNLLCAALDRYISACSALRNGCLYSHDIKTAVECISDELGLAESYKSKLSQAQATVKKARNNLTNVPINLLPAEILTHIFHLVLSEQTCPLRVRHYWSPKNPVKFPKYPDTFSHVCSKWRLVALASPSLWTHIDIALSCPLSKDLHNRAASYAIRAHQAPLDVHFIDPGHYLLPESSEDDSDSEQEPPDPDDDTAGDWVKWQTWRTLVYDNNPEEFTFLNCSPNPQIRSLGLLVHNRYHHIYNRAVEYCLAKCLPNGLSKIIVDMREMTFCDPRFFETSPSLQNRGNRSSLYSDRLFISAQQLENAVQPTTVLELRDRYFLWTSTAYHGLTDLRLLGRNIISGLEFAGILKSSPGLRVLHCDFEIDDSTDQGTSITPVALHELEILDLVGMEEKNVERFLLWLNPGSKPMQLALHGDPTFTTLGAFFGRSNVQEMRVKSRLPSMRQPLHPAMFCVPPQLRILVMVDWGWGLGAFLSGGETARSLSDRIPNDMSSPAQLDTLYMLTCRYKSLRQLQETVAKYSPRRLVLWRCEIYQFGSSRSQLDLAFLESALGSDLSQFCPHIECLTDQDPNPIPNLNFDLY